MKHAAIFTSQFMESLAVETDNYLSERIAAGDKEAFEQIFKKYYKDLCRYALRFLRKEELAEEIVQDLFITLWEKRKKLDIKASLGAYLFAGVKNKSLNYLKSQFARQDFQRGIEELSLSTDNTQETLAYNELDELVTAAINSLPKKNRIIFDLNRNAGMSYQEIADQLNISRKTVENQIGISLKKLKELLSIYMEHTVSLFFMIYFL